MSVRNSVGGGPAFRRSGNANSLTPPQSEYDSEGLIWPTQYIARSNLNFNRGAWTRRVNSRSRSSGLRRFDRTPATSNDKAIEDGAVSTGATGTQDGACDCDP